MQIKTLKRFYFTKGIRTRPTERRRKRRRFSGNMTGGVVRGNTRCGG